MGGTILGFYESVLYCVYVSLRFATWDGVVRAGGVLGVGGFDLVLVALVANIRIHGLCHARGVDSLSSHSRVHGVGVFRTRRGNTVYGTETGCLRARRPGWYLWACPWCVDQIQGHEYLVLTCLVSFCFL